MICKKCNQELPEGTELCPICGEAAEPEAVTEETIVTGEVAEETAVTEEATEETVCEEAPAREEVKKPKSKVLSWVVTGLILVAVIAVLAISSLRGEGKKLFASSDDVTCKGSYVVEDAVAVEKADTVVATMGDKVLTNGELQLYYQNYIYTFYSQYASYMSYIALDLTQPLDKQPCDLAEGQTWEQFFLQNAIENWKQYTLLEILAENDGYEVGPQLQAELDTILPELESYALENGYESIDSYVQDNTAINVNAETYLRFNTVYFTCNGYLDTFYVDGYPTQEEIDAYYAENEATFTENGITKDLGLQSSVRHILVQVDTEAPEEDWNLALAEAEGILDEWKTGEATEDSFAALATKYTDDTASAATGGLYEGINVDASYVAAFLEWSVDDTRVPGDTGIVKTEYGYHIMYFVEGTPYWSMIVGDQIVADRIQATLLTGQAAYPATVNYKKIALADTSMV